ncbi:MAG: phospholipase [Acidimicrobiales bacterium]
MVVDIGGDVGALIVRLDRQLVGAELHLRQDGWTRTVHTGVWDRPLGDRLVTVAVYPALVEGSYQILDRDGSVRRTVRIDGGRVAELDLRS